MKEILNLSLGTSILVSVLVPILLFVAIVLPDIIGDYIDDKREQKEKKDGIEGRWVTTGYTFYIYTIYKNEKYYLNTDGKFYTSTTNIKLYLFNCKKDMEKYSVIRRTLLIQMYFFMEIFEHFNDFEVIKCANNNKRMHDFYDVEPFYYILRKTEDYSFRQSLINEIKEYIQKNMSDFHGVIRTLRSTVNELSDSVLSYRYFRNSSNKVDDIKNIFEELDNTFIIFKDEIGSGQIDEEEVLNQIAEYFIDFVCEFVDFEVVLGTFVAALNKKKMFTFMRLLD